MTKDIKQQLLEELEEKFFEYHTDGMIITYTDGNALSIEDWLSNAIDRVREEDKLYEAMKEFVLSIDSTSQPCAVNVNGLVYLPKSTFESVVENLEKVKKNYKGDNWMIAASYGTYNQAIDNALQIINEVYGERI